LLRKDYQDIGHLVSVPTCPAAMIGKRVAGANTLHLSARTLSTISETLRIDRKECLIEAQVTGGA
jgi:hypothetical protein